VLLNLDAVNKAYQRQFPTAARTLPYNLTVAGFFDDPNMKASECLFSSTRGVVSLSALSGNQLSLVEPGTACEQGGS